MRIIGVPLTWFAIAFMLAATSHAQDVGFIQPPAGYKVERLSLGAGNSASVIAPDPSDENFIYLSGFFNGPPRIVRLDLRDGLWTTVYDTPPTVTIAGMDVLSPDTLFLSDNTNNRLLVLRDFNPADGDFNDPGETASLIDPILTHPTYGWTGSAVKVVHNGNNALGLPAGTALFQSEDGLTTETEGEVLAVVDPLSSPSYQPAGGAFFSGFNYGGGLAIDSAGRLLVASSYWPDTGRIWVCEDLSENGIIDAGESNVIVDRASGTQEMAGLSALAIDGNDRCYVAVGWGGFGAPAMSEIRTFSIPDDPLSETADVRMFATMNSPFISAIVLNTTQRSFAPYADDGATMVIAASDDFYGMLDSLFLVRPFRSAEAGKWSLYK